MTLKDKINKILETNTMGVSTVTGLEVKINVSQGAITTPLRKNGNLGPDVTKKLHETMRINHDWWNTGQGDIYLKNDMTTEKEGTLKESFYKELIEENDDYSLIPSAVLRDYKIVPDKIIDVIIKSNENEKKAIDERRVLEIEGLNQKHERIIEGYEKRLHRLQLENEDLRRQIPIQHK